MKSAQKYALKLEGTEDALSQIIRSSFLREVWVQRRRPATVVSVYYDTEKQKLRKHGVTLEMRRIGRKHLQTVKQERELNAAWDNGAAWEQLVLGPRPQLGVTCDPEFGSLLNDKLNAKLHALFETRVRRRVYSIDNVAIEIEVTLDTGVIVVGQRSSPICEIELKLVRGERSELFNVARKLSQQAPLRLALRSKFECGNQLINGQEREPVGPSPIAVAADTSCQAAFRIIARSCLHQIVANQVLAAEGNIEGVHQARVGLRRLRAAISLFTPILRDMQSAAIKGELKWISSELGPAREIDVFIAHVVIPATDDRTHQRGAASLNRNIRHRRIEAVEDIRVAIQSDRFRLLILDIWAWIEFGDWTNTKDEFAKTLQRQPIATLVNAEMQRRRMKLLKSDFKSGQLDAAGIHKLRIQAKKLRYACEFFEGVFGSRKAKRRRREFSAAVEHLQDTLGDLNDISVNGGLAERLAETTPGGKDDGRSADQAFAAGRLMGREDSRIVSVLTKSKRAYSSFTKAKQFWL